MSTSIFILKNYLRYRFKAFGRHGVHSPFVYDFVCKLLKDKKSYPEYAKFRVVRKRALQDNTMVHLAQIGAGSKIPKLVKTVSQIARTSAQKHRYAALLFRMIRYFNPKNVIELGTSLGLTTQYLAAANTTMPVYTLEGDANVLAKAHGLGLQGHASITIKAGLFDETLPALLQEIQQVDFVFIDGNHSYEATLRYFEMLLPYTHEHSILIFDDIYWTEGMQQAWQEIMSNSAVGYSFDLFQFGIVFFNKAKAKQHFVLKY